MTTLMYHGITTKYSQPPPGREAGAELYDVPLENFRVQMQSLKSSGLRAEITFDDGEMNNYEIALEVLRECGFKAYFFVIVKMIGKPGYMGLAELKKLMEAGHTVGSHGLSHEILTGLKDSQLEEELRASRNFLERNLGIPITTFSVPRGFCNDKIIQMAYDAGYTTVFISDKQECLKLECIPRVAVKSGWSIKRFEQALRGYTPVGETIGDAFKNTAKIVLRGRLYNWVRRILIYVWK